MGNQLPDCEKARVEDIKLYKYLLNPNHPDGKSKARFYELIGYPIDKGEQLRADLLRLACSGSVVDELPNRVGRKYVVVGSIDAPNGKTYLLLTVWAVEPPDEEPRLITAYPTS
ncbi:DUF6883 domain-containing protein [Spirosoma soli]|uniref:DUF6883 domain-containing protein n=1 Tax=Spirosoma soli TaxID=1770529 RepID=A0ABW5M2V3_9BACT